MMITLKTQVSPSPGPTPDKDRPTYGGSEINEDETGCETRELFRANGV
jgi:hypothetical protein